MANGPVLLSAGAKASLDSEQHEGLQVHPEVAPLGQTHLAIDVAKDRRRGIEEVVVVRELLAATGFVLAGNAERRVHLLADREAVGAVRLDETCGVDVVLGHVHGGLGREELAKPCHRFAVDHVNAPRLHVAAAWRAACVFNEATEQFVADGLGGELAYGDAGADGVNNVHTNIKADRPGEAVIVPRSHVARPLESL